MIAFRCICGEPIEVPADLAGEAIQCPVCRRLVDVPTFDIAEGFADDGTVKVGDAHTAPADLGNKFRAFGGRDDMRPAYEDYTIAGDEPALPVRRQATPRYDPVTGELIVPMAIADDEPSPPPPAYDPAAGVLGYARTVPQAPGTKPHHDVTWWNLPWTILTGTGWVAMVVVYVTHVIPYLSLLMPGFNILWAPLTLGVTILVIAHYCNTMEDYGPAGMERVPVLLRTASFGEDALRPLYAWGVAVMLAFAPAIGMALFARKNFFVDNPWVLYVFLAWGMLLFPIACFTMVCGGTLHNLWPHRMLSVLTAAPGQMLLGTLAFWVAMAAYAVASSFVEIGNPANFVNPLPNTAELLKFFAGMGLTFAAGAVAVYAMHVAAAWLGLIYRDYHNDLNWVFQRHDRVYARDAVAEMMGRGRRPTVTTVDPPRPALPVNAEPRGFEVRFDNS